MSGQENRTIEDELQLLVDILPERLKQALLAQDLNDLIEVIMDLGRPAEARFRGKRYITLNDEHITANDLNFVVQGVSHFTSDNRAGIPRTLHRISAIRNRQGVIVGMTCRVGKAITGTINNIKDLISTEKSILLLGPPGVGKTTKLREISRMMADDMVKRVVIVDTSNEIAGDGDIPHPGVGRSRRMQVSSPEKQKEVMIQAVENHTPEVIVVDEIGTEEEAQASRTIAERGVILIATAHGGTLESLIKNPILSDLIGGVQAVTLGDDEAKRRSSQKTVLERENKPTFDICIEIRDQYTMAVYPDVAEAVDHILRGWTIFPEVRRVDNATGETRILQSNVKALPDIVNEEIQTNEIADSIQQGHMVAPARSGKHDFRIFLYSINRAYVDRIIQRLSLKNVTTTNHIHDANAVIALRGSARPGSKIIQLAKDYEVPVAMTKTNTMPQIQRAMREVLESAKNEDADKFNALEGENTPYSNETSNALDEVKTAIDQAIENGEPIELKPQRSYIRRLQHELVEKQDMTSVSVGDEPHRRLKILPPNQASFKA